MNILLSDKLIEIDGIIEKCDFETAVISLRELAVQYPNNGIIPYYLGKVAMQVKDEELAMKYFLVAKNKGYFTAESYLLIGILFSLTDNVSETEKYFVKAIDLSDTLENKWACYSALAVFYLKNQMYMKSEKISKKMIDEYPHNYQGYHIHAMIEATRKMFDEVNTYLEKIPDEFKTHPQYLIDIIEIKREQKKIDELLRLFDTDNRFMNIIPQVVLRERIRTLPNDELGNDKEKLVYQLAKEYGESDAVVSTMILEFGKKNFKKSSQLANIILDNEKKIFGLKYYLALYFQIFNFYYLSNKNPSLKLRKWIENAGNWCIQFTDDLKMDEIADKIRNSIVQLFDEINAQEMN